MEGNEVEWIGRLFEFFAWIVGLAGAALDRLWRQLVKLQSQYPQLLSAQTLFGLIGSGIGVWKYWEGREVNLFRKFERMIEGHEAQLVKARTDLLDVMNRPGPGLLIRPSVFVEKALKVVLARRRLHRAFSLLPLSQSINDRLKSAIGTSDRKVSAHQRRLSFFREEIASARLVQGALAAGRAAAKGRKEHERQDLNLEALDHFRAVLALPGHNQDLVALEFIAHQLQVLDGQSQSAINAYLVLIEVLEGQEASPTRNVVLARAKRCLAILRYPKAPGTAKDLLVEATELLTQFGPPRDRDFLELADTAYREGIARLRLTSVSVQGPQRLSLAQGHYRDLIRSLRARRHGLFRWMSRERRFSGHRVIELQSRARDGLALVNHLIKLNNKFPKTLNRNLVRGNGVPRRNRKPLRLRPDH